MTNDLPPCKWCKTTPELFRVMGYENYFCPNLKCLESLDLPVDEMTWRRMQQGDSDGR